jgi:hypothetical protein
MENLLAIAGLATAAGLSMLAALLAAWLCLESCFRFWGLAGIIRAPARPILRGSSQAGRPGI